MIAVMGGDLRIAIGYRWGLNWRVDGALEEFCERRFGCYEGENGFWILLEVVGVCWWYELVSLRMGSLVDWS